MPIMVSGFSKPKFPPAPEGLQASVCCDVIELGLVRNKFTGDMVEKVRLVWQVATIRSDGKPFEVFKNYRRSLHEKSTLRKDLQAWRGRKFTEAELKAFDLESVLLVPAFLNIVHDPSEDGTVWANVDAVMKLPAGTPAPQVRNYIRKCDRQERQQSAAVPPAGFEDGPDPVPVGITDEDVPFS